MSTTYRRVGFIGDIHAEDVLLERALDFLTGREVELIAWFKDPAGNVLSVIQGS